MPSTFLSEHLKRQLLELLGQHQQQHLLHFWDELTSTEQQELAQQIQSLDLAEIAALNSLSQKTTDWGQLAERAQVPPAITLSNLTDPASHSKAVATGSAALAKGSVAMILVAGGQGTRLGFDLPKGMFPIGPLSGRSLYQIHVEHLLARARQFKTRIPLYVMTSPVTHDATVDYFKQHRNFGLAESDLRVFCQGTLPAVDLSNRIILEQKHRLFASPDGHGGMLAALQRSGCLDEIVKRGIKHIFYGQVDNPLVQVCHPALIGYHIEHGSEMTTQVVRKNDPLQKVGNVVTVDGQVQVIEYSDLPESHAIRTNPDGSLKFWAGSIAVHIFETSFLVRSLSNQRSLPLHLAKKKVPYLNEAGELIQPSEPNAIKFERFIFDLLPWAKNSIVCEVDPADGFCAVKNAPPAASETPEHVKKAISDLHRKWLQEVGAEVDPDVTVEINPLFAVDVETLAQRIPKGQKITESIYFQE
jgi:UDP-N-acetylglucosamine/UDP-N-acetylgalactosamine diphosphorylase